MHYVSSDYNSTSYQNEEFCCCMLAFLQMHWMRWFLWLYSCEWTFGLWFVNLLQIWLHSSMPIEFVHGFAGRKVWNLCRVSLRRAVFALAGTLRSLVFKFLWQSRMLLCRRNRDALCQKQQEQKSSDVRTLTIPKELNEEFLRCIWLIIQSTLYPQDPEGHLARQA